MKEEIKLKIKLGLLSVLLTTAVSIAESKPLYKNAKASTSERVEDLWKRMTLDEKVQQLAQMQMGLIPSDEGGLKRKFSRGIPGFICANPKSSLAQTAAKVTAIQTYLKTKTRLGIPAIIGVEALHGVLSTGATIYPQSIALGASWNTPLVHLMGTQVAKEASAAGITQALSPVLDLARDARFGRVEECYSECPILTSEMAYAYITGLQGGNSQKGLGTSSIYAMLKHFAGYSVPANGINIAPALIGKREMLSLHLVPFEKAVKDAGVMSVMPAYNSVDGMPCHADPWLLTTLLRKQWGFKGYVYSDWSAIDLMLRGQRVAKDVHHAGQLAFKAGVDMEAPHLRAFSRFAGEVRAKRMDEKLIDRSVRRVLRAKFIAGLFDSKRSDGDIERVKKVTRQSSHVKLSQMLAEESIILLQNKGNLLPLNPKKLKSIALIGPNAAQVQFGDYTWSKSNKHGINLKKALSKKYAKDFKINYAKGCDLTATSTKGFAAAVEAAKNSDVAVVVLGDTSMIFSGVGWEDPTVPNNGTVGEGFDTHNPVPPGVQVDLVKAIVATGKPVVVILVNGRPYCIPWMKDNVTAIVEAFYPGERQGVAISKILMGETNPSGRLPVTIARSAGHIPCTYDFKPYGRGFYHQPGRPGRGGRDYIFSSPAPLWSFGYGLSYTSFKYSDLKTDKSTLSVKDDKVKISFKVKNTGKVTGKVVPQVYWRDLIASTAPPEKRLLRFKKIQLAPGESKMVSFTVPVKEFWGINPKMHKVVEPGDIHIQVGDYAESSKLLVKKLTLK